MTAEGEQIDLFLDSMINAPMKDERAVMEFPFFSLQKQPRRTPMIYDDGKVQIRIDPGPKGIATIYDKDVLIYVASAINDRIERGLPVSRTVRFAAYDFLKATERGVTKDSYERFLDTLHRLRATTITTTIKSGDQTERRGFGWVDNWRVVERKTKDGSVRMAGIEVTLNDWMFRAIVNDRRVLTINRDYFSLTMALERRLYELARKHVGRQPEWRISLERLHQKCGATDTLRKFKWRLKEVIDRDNIPDYRIEIALDPSAPREFKPPRRLTLEKTLICFLPRTDGPVARTSPIGIMPPRGNGNMPESWDREHDA